MNLHREIRQKTMLTILFIVAVLNANAHKLYTVYRMIF